MSWISLADALGAIRRALDDADMRGPVNLVAPGAVTNAEFTRVLARVLHRPAIFPVPAPALRLLLGEMGDALLLASQHVRPEKLVSAGFKFQNPELEPGLLAILGNGA